MKRMTKIAAAALVAGGMVAGIAAHAATINSNPGDLILAFEIPDQNSGATGGQENLEVDLGTLASLNAAASANGGSVNLSNFLSVADLTSTYGSGWNTTNSGNGVFWTVFGASGSTNEVLTTDSVRPNSDTSGHLGITNGNMGSIYTDLSGVSSTANSNYAYVTSSSSDPDSFTQDIDGSNWGDSYGDIPGNVLRPTTNSAAFNLYDLVPSSSQTPATDVGSFALGSNGTLTYTEAVPEPSTWATILVGIGGLLAFRRRRA